MEHLAKAPRTTDIAFTTTDGLRLVGRRHHASRPAGARRSPPLLPLLCLSSLTGNMREFDALATFLSGHPSRPRDVYALDYRGRGLSQADTDPENYTPYVELRDILDFLAAADLPRFHLLGSSRGGMNAMLLATSRAGAVASVILNDIGPVLQPDGVARLMGQLAELRPPADWPEAARLMQRMYGPQFPALDNTDYPALARIWFREEDGHLRFSFDPKLAKANRRLDLRRAMPEMWSQFLALRHHPLLIIRGENSDMLSERTLERMLTLHLRARAVSSPGQGHPPLLRDRAALHTVHKFLLESEN